MSHLRNLNADLHELNGVNVRADVLQAHLIQPTVQPASLQHIAAVVLVGGGASSGLLSEKSSS